jgi:hypothetical protein
MTTKRNSNKPIENLGVEFIKSIVKSHNCIYQAISLNNDQGNDCFIEFIDNNIATSFCVFAQIKSGKSYKDKTGYKIPADLDHLQYWNNHLLPIAGIVFDVDLERAYWVNITEYLKVNPQILLNKSHNIRVDRNNELSLKNFSLFRVHFTNYSRDYKNYENFGRSLEAFTNIAQPEICYTGLKSLFANHRERQASWYYIILNFANIREKGIQINILGMLSNYLENSTVFWNSEDYLHYQASSIRLKIADFINELFTPKAVKVSLSYLKDGIAKGSFAYLVFLVLNQLNDIHDIIYQLALSKDIELNERNNLFWLYIHFAQHRSIERTIAAIDDFLIKYPNNEEAYLFEGIKETIIKDGYIQTG